MDDATLTRPKARLQRRLARSIVQVRIWANHSLEGTLGYDCDVRGLRDESVHASGLRRVGDDFPDRERGRWVSGAVSQAVSFHGLLLGDNVAHWI